ncbi:MBL fold metallo-hydrolase [Bacteriovoracaceae bacterium]|nr:MBL fold metallo-hydrolase [Bacteriovoracaceae bacterium]
MIGKDKLEIETFPMGDLGCNCSLIYSPKSKEAIIIDPGNDAVSLMKLIKERQLTVKLLLHTHAHFDHIGQSQIIHEQTGAKRLLHKDDLFLYEGLPQQGMFFGVKMDVPSPLEGYLNNEESFGFSETLSLEDQSLKQFIKVLHTPGHTPGSVCFYTDCFKEPVLFSGDTLFQSSIGRTDLPGGDTDKILVSIKQRLYTLPDETNVICGHGPQTRIFEEKRNNPFIR